MDDDVKRLETALAQMQRELDRVTAERDAALAGAVKVKPLEWNHVQPTPEFGQDKHTWATEGYWIVLMDDGYVLCDDIKPDWLPVSPYMGCFDTVEDAKAAAQSDHEARIRAALIPDPAALDRIKAKAFAEGHKAGMLEATEMIVSSQVAYTGDGAIVEPAWNPGQSLHHNALAAAIRAVAEKAAPDA